VTVTGRVSNAVEDAGATGHVIVNGFWVMFDPTDAGAVGPLHADAMAPQKISRRTRFDRRSKLSHWKNTARSPLGERAQRRPGLWLDGWKNGSDVVVLAACVSRLDCRMLKKRSAILA
jgi:hypothetical protein